MNIVVATKSYLPLLGGSIHYARMLATEFASLGNGVVLVTRTPGDPDSDKDAVFPIVRNPTTRRKLQLAGWCDAILQVDASWTDVWPFLLLGKPWFPTIHRGKQVWGEIDFRSKVRLLFESLGYRVGHSIAVSHLTAQDWQITDHTIPNPYDSNIFNLPEPGDGRDIDILYVGRIVEEKGVFILLKAIETLTKDVSIRKVAFIGGGGGLDKLKSKVAECVPAIRVEFPGIIPPEEVASWMGRSRVLALPTTPRWIEASPLTTLEAAACGCRIVASDSGGTRENVPPEDWIVESDSREQLEKALREALQAPAPEPCARESFLEKRRIKAVAEKYLALFAAELS